jgi:hypothetical protein
MDQTQAGQPWNVLVDDGGIDGGHCVPIMGYGSAGATCITWGALQQMSWDWFLKYCDEAYVEISTDWLNSQGLAPNALNMDVLQNDIKALAAA